MSDIQDLFDKDPLHITLGPDGDLAKMVKYFREKRAQFVAGDMQAGSTKRIKKAATPSVKTNLDDILKGL